VNAVVKPRFEFARESVADVMDEIRPLLEQHWKEIAHYPDIPLDPDYGRYRTLETLGLLRIFTARHDGQLVGYAIYAVNFSLHYRNSRQAQQDVLFVLPAYRRTRLGTLLVLGSGRRTEARGRAVCDPAHQSQEEHQHRPVAEADRLRADG
jgi:GNAT superfamily N-acetyltransferase